LQSLPLDLKSLPGKHLLAHFWQVDELVLLG